MTSSPTTHGLRERGLHDREVGVTACTTLRSARVGVVRRVGVRRAWGARQRRDVHGCAETRRRCTTIVRVAVWRRSRARRSSRCPSPGRRRPVASPEARRTPAPAGARRAARPRRPRTGRCSSPSTGTSPSAERDLGSSTVLVTAMSMVGVTGLTVTERRRSSGSRSGWSVLVRAARVRERGAGVHRGGDGQRRGLARRRACGMAHAPVARIVGAGGRRVTTGTRRCRPGRRRERHR